MIGTPKSQTYLDLENWSVQSSIWVYPSSRIISASELDGIQETLDQFTNEWTAHNVKLKAKAWIEKHRFLILMVDQSQTGASGCSIDTSVRFVQMLGNQLETDFFDRMTFYYLNETDRNTLGVKQSDLASFYQQGKINDQTLFYNVLVSSLLEFQNNWQVPFKESWQYRMM